MTIKFGENGITQINRVYEKNEQIILHITLGNVFKNEEWQQWF